MLINQQNPINEDFTLNLTNYKESDMYIDSTIALDYTALVDAVKLNTDSNIYIMSSYRDANKQKEVYLEDPKIAALPNTSEHETGMALDIYTPQYAGSAFIKTKAGQYVNEHCDEFGFIIRYPINKKSITKIKYEPWHIRYVGLPHSTIMSHNNLCLEEYITSLNPNVFYKTDNYIISRQSQDTLTVPINTYDINISPDNTGYYIITAKIKELN